MGIVKYNTSEVNLWFTSDLHFGHKRILEYCPWRPGSESEDIELMNDTLIDNWNSVVKKDDIVYILGDVAFLSTTKYCELLDQLNGHKHLVRGNHDRERFPKRKVLDKYKSVQDQLQIEIDGQPVYLNHYPFLCWGGMGREIPVIQLHGHIHSHPGIVSSELFGGILRPTQYDVGVDNNNMYPVSWEQIKERMKL